MGIIGIDHVQLAMPCGREDEARAFYGELLGLAEIPKPPDLAKNGGCWFQSSPGSGAVHIHLGVEDPFVPARKAHPALLVADYAELTARLETAGVEVTPGSPLEGYRRGFVSDPFGNRIELMQKL